MAVRSGREFLQGLQDDREVWLEGERVDDVTTHPKLGRMASTLARLYDLQHDPGTRDLMSFESPVTGDPISLSYMIPESVDDLVRRRGAFEVTATESFGMLGRTPDYCNIIVTAMRQMADVYGENDPRYTENVISYYRYVSENDLCLTHTFGHPQANLSLQQQRKSWSPTKKASLQKCCRHRPVLFDQSLNLRKNPEDVDWVIHSPLQVFHQDIDPGS